MLVAVMKVGIVRMLVHQRYMAVPMTVRLARRIARRVGMLVMLIVNVPVFVFEFLVPVGVVVSLCKVKV